MISIPEFFITSGYVFIFACCAYTWGTWLSFGYRDADPTLDGCIKIGTGVGVLALLAVAMGYGGFLTRGPVLLGLILTLAAGFKSWKSFAAWFRAVLDQTFRSGGGLGTRVLQGLLAVLFLTTFILCFFPEISNDALAHHLNLAKRYMQSGLIAPLQYDIKSYQSLLMNSLYSVALLLQGAALAKVMHWLTGALLVLAVTAWVRKLTSRLPLALFMGLMLLLTPTLMNQIATTYVDAATAFFVFLGFYLWSGPFQGSPYRGMFLSGILLGFAVITKLSALLACAAIGVLSLWKLYRTHHKREEIQSIIFWALGFLFASGFFFFRNWLLTGDALFPMFSRLQAEDFSQVMYHLGPPKTILSYIALPFYITLRPQDYDYHHWVGPFYLMVLPMVIFAIFKKSECRSAAVFCFLYATGWFFGGQNVRYMLPMLPIYIVMAAQGIQLASEKAKGHPWMRSAILLTGISVLTGLLALTAFHFRREFRALRNGSDRTAYLESLERSYPIAAWVNQTLSSDSKILSVDEVRLFYFDPTITRANMLVQREPELATFNAAELKEALQKKGFTHLLFSSRLDSQKEPPHSLKSLNDLRDPKRLLHRIDSRNERESRYQYELYAL